MCSFNDKTTVPLIRRVSVFCQPRWIEMMNTSVLGPGGRQEKEESKPCGLGFAHTCSCFALTVYHERTTHPAGGVQSVVIKSSEVWPGMLL